ADGQDDTNPNYSFTWYQSLDLSGPVFATTSTISGLGSGEYSVEVYNALTNCTNWGNFYIYDQAGEFMPMVDAGTEPMENCVNPDGVVFARALAISNYPAGLAPPAYEFDWWIGDNPTPGSNPDYALTDRVENLEFGFYTVRLTDTKTGCTDTTVVEIKDTRVDPIITVLEDNPLINCDPARPNGQLSTIIDGGQPSSSYTFEWYEGATATGPIIHDGDKLIGITMGQFTVRVTNNRTGCVADMTGEVTDGRLSPPLPTPEVLNHMTSCISPNGKLTVTVEGETVGYDFLWYAGPDGQGAPIGTNPNIIKLDIGLYSVTATDQITGCTSEPVPVEILDYTVAPELGYAFGPSYCETPTGFAEVMITNQLVVMPNGTDTLSVLIDKVYWVNLATNDTTIGTGIYNQFAGFYEATVISTEGCETKETVEIVTEVFPYQGVSANGDGLNDYFHIDCISNFPNNIVRIYNRAGILVYEDNGYDNSTVIFEGIGKNGMYPFGREVPDGTYFYVIDKGDGSKPAVGYLELIR
ncbi:MAG: gliding motility-associated C-terminal domain-containing protein, partial [Cyclobacteriaceae bacterium]|nr:gliding motility-associated C-terminal domain-containing protein [Cyclobacteriaceae bacterium]